MAFESMENSSQTALPTSKIIGDGALTHGLTANTSSDRKPLVISDFNSWSFDSRYFGPIRSSLVEHRLRPLWTFHTKVPAP